MVKKKFSKMSAKARMAYVRSFIGKKKSGSKKKSGGKFPKGSLSEWRAKANSGNARERAKYKRAIENWNKLMSKAGFKQKWDANKIRRGGALEDGVNYRDLIGMYQGRSFGMGFRKKAREAVRTLSDAFRRRRHEPIVYANGGSIHVASGAGCKKGSTIRGAAIRGAAIRGASLPPEYYGVKGRKFVKSGGSIHVASGSGYVPGKGLMTPKMSKKFEQIYRRHVRQGAGITKRDLYRGAGKQHSLFFTRDSMLRRQRKKPMTITAPDDEMVQLYRNLYKRSGIHPENMIDPIVRNDRLQGAGIFKKIGKAVAKPVKFIRKNKVVSKVGSVIPGKVGVAVRTGAKILGAGLIEEASLNGRGHPPYIYH